MPRITALLERADYLRGVYLSQILSDSLQSTPNIDQIVNDLPPLVLADSIGDQNLNTVMLTFDKR